jgi:diguanylate cyclase (GGDEF)-like protein
MLVLVCLGVLVASRRMGEQITVAGNAALDESVVKQLQLDATREPLAFDEYRLDGGEQSLEDFRASYLAVDEGLERVLELGEMSDDGTDDAEEMKRLSQLHAAYRAEGETLLGLLSSGQRSGLQDRLQHMDVLAAQIESGIAAVEAEHEQVTTAALLEAKRNGQLVKFATPAVLVLTALILLSLWTISRNLQRALRRQTLHDSLTGLPNRVLFQERAAQALAVAVRTGEVPVVMMLDLDRFKEVNDTLGHATGDLLLQQLGRRLSTVVRPQDTVARFGGDEFGVLLNAGGPVVATQVATRILQALEAPFLLDGITVGVEASIGITTPDCVPVGTQFSEQVDDLLRQADTAMYVAKSERCGMSRYAAGEENAVAHEHLSLLSEMREALEQDQFFLHYQPKVHAGTGELSGLEALVRWQHPTRGLVGPDRFIPLAESSTLIHRLTDVVLTKALAFTRERLDEGVRLQVSVNVSTRILLDRQFPSRVQDHLHRSGVTADLLMIEITESTIMADPQRALATLAELREMGISLSVDDYGTGYSSMAYLKLLPICELKVDRSFVRHMASDQEDALLVQSAIELGHNLGLTVVAEGVENGATLRALQELGADDIQGYYLARPMPQDALRDWMNQRATAHTPAA